MNEQPAKPRISHCAESQNDLDHATSENENLIIELEGRIGSILRTDAATTLPTSAQAEPPEPLIVDMAHKMRVTTRQLQRNNRALQNIINRVEA